MRATSITAFAVSAGMLAGVAIAAETTSVDFGTGVKKPAPAQIQAQTQVQEPAPVEAQAPVTASEDEIALERKGVDAVPESAPQANAAEASDDLEGKTVVSLNGDTVGKVREVHVDENGEFAGITAEFGGVLGFGAKTIEVPVGAIEIKSGLIVLAMTGQEIRESLN
ncbi:PRC-barrel domain-containing protein [Roseibium sp. RKSG952]|uniref:PRC-barrel domain-containing protein n=1 Tax=Roseibium sp. RKSG952 TaxID=2529384 RepID=UPI0012BB548B|nr:PRC-barrel domain-containing protein [Roseibium sp. RKSG952]MTH97032.1 PRC-barrel domain containing protein [Roseibium sp. RKSG952]